MQTSLTATEAVQAALQAHRDMPGALLPILHGVQDRLGHVPADAVPAIADALNLSRAEVHGVLTYYHHFRQQPAARRVVELCRAEACQARGAEALAGHVQRALGCGFHETSADGQVTLEPVYCLGHCAVGPNIAIDGRPYARVHAARFDALLQSCGGEQ
ncbi:formate dehydrogenase subunit gamma [Janthinobacterium sp. PC23-8]|uniref:formate dehydrogenase subunit gamma n=1 Tax=Janthinobacterium sp. PC23-8 TaxID=2012679 RepID=UPI000B97B346|nr:formate dehydrogenase subunit gamma [Janthinobacterium sp. PC23-8]OYO29272.1 formate dehydrogenase subunit gamma [Janthinobacterium sp. PC23-8]